jgi:beta-glucosidase
MTNRPAIFACLAFGIAALMSTPGRSAQPDQKTPLYLDAAQPVDKRVEDLLARMTLSEKIGQMNMPCVYIEELGRDAAAKREGCRKFALGNVVPGVGPAGGFFTLADNALPEGSRQQAEYFNALQKEVIETTRLKIPLLQSEEGTHGVMCSGKTVLPEGLAIGSTWNMDLVRQIYAAEGKEARGVGIHQLYTLVIEPNRDPRLGRNQEGYSEDPYLCSRIAQSIVQGAQGKDLSAPDKVVTGLCHYPGQSQPVSGFERGAMEISERTLRDVFLPPWVAGIKTEGALGVMATYPAIDGVPTHSSDMILTKILREELGFQGLVLSEGGGIGTLVTEQVAADQKEAGAMALRAGLDVGISYEAGFMDLMIENVKEGKVPMELIDRAVRRILKQKMTLGLFERPYVDVSKVSDDAHRKLALQVAREGIVLLKNERNLLPLENEFLKSIAVIGPNADDVAAQLGDYTPRKVTSPIVTVLEGIKRKVGAKTQVFYAKGCSAIGDRDAVDQGEAARLLAEAQDVARKAKVAVVVVGEDEKGNGESKDVASLDLPGLQEDLIKAVQSTGTPTVVVLINGRPLSIRWTAAHVPAIIEAWRPGEEGGTAVADVLFGDYNPSGRLPITVPRHVGQLPMYYNYSPSKAMWKSVRGYVDMSASPLWEFGYGLSYTKFEYSDLRVQPAEIQPTGSVHVRVRVKNTGESQGQEVVQLYLHDELASVTRPVKALKAFQKIAIEPGESKEVEFVITPEDMSLLDRNLKRIVEPGRFEVMVGSSSEAIHARGHFDVK